MFYCSAVCELNATLFASIIKWYVHRSALQVQKKSGNYILKTLEYQCVHGKDAVNAVFLRKLGNKYKSIYN